MAKLYNVKTKHFKEAVRRIIDNFPDDFIFVFKSGEFENLRSQFATSSWGGTKYTPMAFTEHCVAILSGILKSKQAREVNIAIMRAFVRMRKFIDSNKELAAQFKKLESRLDKNDEAIRQLMQPPNPPRKKIGFKIEELE